MQELVNNSGHAKPPRQVINCSVTLNRDIGDNVHLIRLAVPDTDLSVFQRPGSFVFVRTCETAYYDVPISVLYSETDTDTIGLLIQTRGIKTKPFEALSQNDTVYLRGPFYNGVMGHKPIGTLSGKHAVVLCRGIGFFPSLHVIQTLKAQNNSVSVYLDPGDFSRSTLDMIRELFEIETIEMPICNSDGELSEEACRVLSEAASKSAGLIHLGLSDYLISKSLDYIRQQGYANAVVSCSNNAHMCCGEGICGACAGNISPMEIVHLCKEQISPYDYVKIVSYHTGETRR